MDTWTKLLCVCEQEYTCNMRPRGPSNKNLYKGVFPTLNGLSWKAIIYNGGKQIYLGTFPTQEAAYAAYLCKQMGWIYP